MDRPPVLECPVWSVPPVSLPSTTIRILRLIEMTLDDDDFDLQLAHSGEEAIQLAESVELDAILLDIMMPGMTGIEVLEELRRNSNVPVILVSARDANADKVRGLDLGADDYISKPFSVEELRARLRAVLRRSFSREQLTGG